jgi:hypothetical protein
LHLLFRTIKTRKMNKLLLYGFVAILLTACIESEVVKVEYRSTTMMGRTMVTITKDSVTTSFNGRGEPWSNSRSTTPGEWTDLLKLLSEIKLKDIPTYEAPTNKRDTDAAPFATLFVHTKDSTFESKTFDGYDAHDMLQPTMDQIEKMAEKK